MNNDLPETGTIESLKIMVNTIKQYCLPEYLVNGKGQKPFIGVVLDEVVKEIEASICRQETLQETAAADAKYIAAIPALSRGEEVPCALHVSEPIKQLHARIAELEQMVRELVKSAKTKHGKVTTYSIPIDLCHKALALLQPEEETNGQR